MQAPDKRRARTRACSVAMVVAATLATVFTMASGPVQVIAEGRPEEATLPNLGTNEAFLSGLFTDLPLEDPLTVFAFVFERLAPEVTVYPSEGYYYFRFPMRGVMVKGSLHLSASLRDEGIISFGYTGEIEDRPRGAYATMPGRSVELDASDGLSVRRMDDFNYEIGYRSKVVVFHLYDPGLDPPPAGALGASERYLCTALDESGLFFDLVWSGSRDRLFWILNERRFLPEALLEFGTARVVGARTGFVFYLDDRSNRKVLIGVHADDVEHNTWYDGPFDQLPDTYVKIDSLEFAPFLAAHTGLDPLELDRYGHFIRRPGTRAAIAPYRFYRSQSEFDFITESLVATCPRDSLFGLLTAEVGREHLAAAAESSP